LWRDRARGQNGKKAFGMAMGGCYDTAPNRRSGAGFLIS
jgi:hypothetical protein